MFLHPLRIARARMANNVDGDIWWWGARSMFSCVCVCVCEQIMMSHARCNLTTSNARVTGANSRGTLLEPQKDPSVLEDLERSDTIPVSPQTWVHDVFFMEDIYFATFPCHLHSFSATDQCLTNLQEKPEVSACAQPCLRSPRMRCSSSSGTPWAFRGSSAGQAPEGTCCHAAAGIWEQPRKSKCSKVVALPRTSSRSAAPSTPLLLLPKDLAQVETGRIKHHRYQFKVTLWQLTTI